MKSAPPILAIFAALGIAYSGNASTDHAEGASVNRHAAPPECSSGACREGFALAKEHELSDIIECYRLVEEQEAQLGCHLFVYEARN